MNNIELACKAYEIATKYKTLYVTGGQGQRLKDDSVKKMFIDRYASNKENRYKAIMDASPDTWAFDCNGLIKSIINGWCGDYDQPRGGSVYDLVIKDITCETMISECEDVSTDFSRVEIGELLYMPGHVGVCVSSSPLLGVECTAKWTSNVLVSAINSNVSGYERRDWQKHGKMTKYIEYPGNYIYVPATYLKEGIHDNSVKVLQRLLTDYNVGAIDGRFGPQTAQAVKLYQRAHKDINGEQLEVDGKVGPLTWGALLRGD